MVYEPFTDETKQQWIVWLNDQAGILDGKTEYSGQEGDSAIFETEDGDVATAKDLVGNFLAFLTNKPIKIE